MTLTRFLGTDLSHPLASHLGTLSILSGPRIHLQKRRAYLAYSSSKASFCGGHDLGMPKIAVQGMGLSGSMAFLC